MSTIGAFAAIVDDEGRILCVRANYGRRGWTTPGGRVEPNESLIESLQREVREEVGCDVEVDRLLGVYAKPDEDDIVFSFEAHVVREGSWRPNEEISERRYFALDELPEPMSAAARMRIVDALNGRAGVYRVLERRTAAPNNVL